MTRSLSNIATLLLIALIMPVVVFAQTTGTGTGTGTDVGSLAVNTPTANGIYGCNSVGAQSVGSRSAIGGTYVPVSDAAVTLNTGYLVYLECVLRPLVDAQRKAVSIAYVSNNMELYSKGRDGNPMWVVNYANERTEARKQGYIKAFQSELLSNLNPAFQNQVKTALVRNYQMVTEAPQNNLTCPYQGDLRAVATNPQQNFSYAAMFAIGDPNCNPVYAYMQAQDQLSASVAMADSEWINRLTWNNGIYDVRDANGNVTTPGIFVGAIGTQSVTSGFRQLENADNIGQIVGSMFAGIGSKLLSSAGGIPSILASNGSDSYLAQAIQQEQNGLLGQASGVALQNLYAILNWEQQYNSVLAETANVLTNSINQLRSSEKACWDLIVPKVCTSGSLSGTTCTATSGGTLTVATSTQFSDAAIAAAGIGSAATALEQAVNASNQNIATINSLIVAVQSTDPNARNTALQNLDILVNANPPVLHTESSINTAREDLAAVRAQMQGSQGVDGFVKKTQQAWAGDAIDQFGNLQKSALAWDGSINPGTGWCNINKQSTLDQWIQKWSQ
ncbi:hypothetical protein C4568_04735 [Candidatus Parcubacteria bacterium]|nr:MAG: hypothetical protein C4568_04735 [Candidatus Parcubacteria bacterium]